MFGISLRPEQFLAARELRWIHSQAAAVHQFLFPELVNSDVILTNARDVHGPVVAEQVIAMMFALARQIATAAMVRNGARRRRDIEVSLTPVRNSGATV